MKKLLAWLAAGLMSAPAAFAASPSLLSEASGISFAQYSGSATVGTGSIDDASTLYFIPEAVVDGLQSWYIFLDASGRVDLNALLQFDGDIVAVFDTRSAIDASTATYGLDSVRYGSRGFTGLENSDSVTWSGNVLLLDWRVGDRGDHLRVLTVASPVPEPANVALLGGGLVLVLWLSRRRLRRD